MIRTHQLLSDSLSLHQTVDTVITVISGYMVALLAPYGRLCVLITLALLSCYGGGLICIVIYAMFRFFQCSRVVNKPLDLDIVTTFRRTFRVAFLGFTAASIHEVDTGMLPLKHMKNTREANYLSLMDTGLGYFVISDALNSSNQSRLYWKTQIYLLTMGCLRILINFYFSTADAEEYGPYWNSFLTILLVRFLNMLVKPLKWAQKLLCAGVLMILNQFVLSLYPHMPILRFPGPWAATLGYFPLRILAEILFKTPQNYSTRYVTQLKKKIILLLLSYYFINLLFQTGINAHLMSPSVVLILLLTTYYCWGFTIYNGQTHVPPVRGRWAFLSANILTGLYKILNPRGIYFVSFEVLYFIVLVLSLNYI